MRTTGYLIAALTLLIGVAACDGADSSSASLPGGNSFAAGTEVVTPSGVVAIESLQVGDQVLSLDPVSGDWSAQPILAVNGRSVDQELFEVATADGAASFVATGSHVAILAEPAPNTAPEPIRLSGGRYLSNVADLSTGDRLQTSAGSLTVDAVSRFGESTTVYSLVVARNHTYAVTPAAIAVADTTIRTVGQARYDSSYVGGACFPAGTIVLTPDGPREIQELAVGEPVLAVAVGAERSRGVRRTVAQRSQADPVVGVSRQAYEGDMITIVADGTPVVSTGNHPFRVAQGHNLARRPPALDVPSTERGITASGRWVEARALQVGDLLTLASGGTATVQSVASRHVATVVYNITVAGQHTYAVSNAGFVVHNKGQAEADAAPTGAPMLERSVPPPSPAPPTVFTTEEYNPIVEPGFKRVTDEPLSTLSIDVDTASYSNVRRFLTRGIHPPQDAVRIEELINYFSYSYPEPADGVPFSFTTELAENPWNSQTLLLQVGLQAEQLAFDQLPPNNLVFLLDVSGSMNQPNKLPLLKESLLLLVDQLRPIDRVSIVVYAGAAGLVLPPTPGSDRQAIAAAFDRLRAGGSTAGGEGIRLAYDVAQQHFDPEGNNRVILGTDGDFNVGPSSQGELQRIIEQERERGVYLTVLGFGTGNYADARMETLSNAGNGNYAYIDTLAEAEKSLVREMAGTLYSVANDVKIQIEFNPAVVAAYRIIGYENRLLEAEDFTDDRKDAGEMGIGHSVTVLYELDTTGNSAPQSRSLRYQTSGLAPDEAGSGELMLLSFRYKPPGQDRSVAAEAPIPFAAVPGAQVSTDFRLASSLAAFGMLLRDSDYRADAAADAIVADLERTLGQDPYGYRRELVGLVKLYQWLPAAQ